MVWRSGWEKSGSLLRLAVKGTKSECQGHAKTGLLGFQ